MKAVGYKKSLPISDVSSLIDIELPTPIAKGHDLLIQVKAVSVNPVDFKVRQNMTPQTSEYKILGWDAVGEAVAVGSEVSLFQPGDLVYYAGDLMRDGSNAEYQLVDERIVGKKPKSLTDAQAASLPLTSITAYELLFDHLSIQRTEENQPSGNEVLLVMGAAGGVGSILIQLAKALTNATVIASASRASSIEWVKSLGADHVIDHSKPIAAQISQLKIGEVTHIAGLTHTDSYFNDYIELIKPKGTIAIIDDPQSLDISKIKLKSIAFHWEFMFTRSMFNTDDMIEQHKLLNHVSELIDQGRIINTVGKHFGKINAANLKSAHELLESGKSIGKIVLEEF
ncbi:zinc-binding alcohol dehydrogenase family protein [Shewanella sp. OPT22]|nr:zinc-binding alcohol dehydrogenase family protein [Shewanella sp. OPT22]